MQDIISSYRNKIRAIIKKMTGSNNEDLEQEVYIRTWRSFSRYQEEGKLGQWIGVITANLCRDYFKSKAQLAAAKQSTDDEVLDNIAATDNPETIFDARTRQKIILKAVNSLPAKMREVVILHEFEDYSCGQIAQKLKISEGTVKSRLFNARKILAQVLKPLQGE